MWLASVITDKPMVKKLCRARISVNQNIQLTDQLYLVMIAGYANPSPLLSDSFQRDADSSTEAL